LLSFYLHLRFVLVFVNENKKKFVNENEKFSFTKIFLGAKRDVSPQFLGEYRAMFQVAEVESVPMVTV